MGESRGQEKSRGQETAVARIQDGDEHARILVQISGCARWDSAQISKWLADLKDLGALLRHRKVSIETHNRAMLYRLLVERELGRRLNEGSATADDAGVTYETARRSKGLAKGFEPSDLERLVREETDGCRTVTLGRVGNWISLSAGKDVGTRVKVQSNPAQVAGDKVTFRILMENVSAMERSPQLVSGLKMLLGDYRAVLEWVKVHGKHAHGCGDRDAPGEVADCMCGFRLLSRLDLRGLTVDSIDQAEARWKD